ncbi:hypothetical protein FB566_1981 [Stackebrandtia endophytica]|uniref:Peptidoglycan binding protein n=1 Tax=Stackebrandtia endophytica TaxID=1496996 RepID=A0A543AV91_9ACTN|nr:hypothetical protein FB566_1981 [Stackebrandtia endophytica]
MVLVMLLCLVLTGAAFLAGQWIKSPEQRAAEAAPPAPTMLTVPIEERVLSDTVAVRGVVEAERSIEVVPGAAAGAQRLIVSGVRVSVGDTIRSGEVLAVVSGRPIIVLRGAIPSYRDLVPGAEGEDVTQLQDALRSNGSTINDPTGHYGSSTQAGVAALYDAAGFTIARANADEDALLRDARNTLTSAQQSLTEAEALPEDERPDLAALRREVSEAQTALDDLEAVTGAALPMNEVVFVPEFPAEVTAVSARAGEPVVEGEAMVVLSGGKLVARGQVNRLDAEALTLDMPVSLLNGTEELTGTLSAIAEAQSSGETGGPPQFEVTVDADFPEEWSAADLRMTVIVSQTETEVLVVPITAIFSKADGKPTVVRLRDGQRESINVTVGATGDGYVEIASPELSVGDQVVVGQS